MKFASVLLIALVSLGILGSISMTYGALVKTQMCIIIDGSGSITDTKWAIMKNGTADAINHTIPKDGSVELTVVQIGYSTYRGFAKTELPPTVLNSKNYATVIDLVLAIVKSNHTTSIAHGIYLAWNEIYGSPNFLVSEDRVIVLATDGGVNVRNYNATTDLDGSGGLPDELDDVIATVNYAVSQGLDELDVLGVGTNSTSLDWLKNWVVCPQPAHSAPLFGPGWIREVFSASVFAGSLTLSDPDINDDGLVDIFDAIMLAGSFGSNPSSMNWNGNADLNSDNIVDIYDAIILATQYN